MTVLAGRAAGERLRERTDRPDAVFAANDLLAVGLLQALTMLGGIRVPDDIALVGYDDIDFAAATVVPLTSVRQPAETLGSTAVDLLLRQLDGELDPSERQVRFPARARRAGVERVTASAGSIFCRASKETPRTTRPERRVLDTRRGHACDRDPSHVSRVIVTFT